MSKAAASGNFVADLYTTPDPPLTVGRFVDRPTPGNVGVCLSGGGSRALTAGMGQLRGLKALGLLEKTRALSTVSGGSWLGVTFTFLPPATSDDAYLNEYVPDPGQLVPTETSGHTPAETLDQLPTGNIGGTVANRLFSLPALAVEAFLLYKFFKVPPNFLWQSAIGLHILRPYGLYMPGRMGAPTSLFSWDPETLDRDVTRGGTQLTGVTPHLAAAGRAYLCCNTSMFLVEPGNRFRLLAPVQATPFFSGIVGSPTGTDVNGREPGGGGVTSFAFSSNPNLLGPDPGEVTVGQMRQWSITDIVGASSAAFAETLGNLFAQWADSPDKFLDLLDGLLDDVLDFLTKRLGHLSKEISTVARFLLKHEIKRRPPEMMTELKSDFGLLRSIIPEYAYWPVAGAQAYPQTLPTQFADGGSLENTGVASMLSYGDIDGILACVNSGQRLEPIPEGVIAPDGSIVPGTGVLISGQVPPLFGYQPYKQGVGYKLYAGDDNPTSPIYMNNQVFPSERFAEMLSGIWQASGAGTYHKPALFPQTLEVQENPWFGVVGLGRTVKVLWFYTARVRDFYRALAPDVQAILGDFDDPKSFNDFPHYSTFKTDLTPTEVNLMASLTAWTVAADENRGQFEALYGG